MQSKNERRKSALVRRTNDLKVYIKAQDNPIYKLPVHHTNIYNSSLKRIIKICQTDIDNLKNKLNIS